MLSGSAGSGKSTIAKSVAIELEKGKCLAASFFFSRNYQERRLITSLPVTLAYQFACYNSSFKDLLVKMLDENPKILDAAAKEQFEHLVVGLLAKMPSCTTPWIICLDALDECEKDHQQDCRQDCRHHKQDRGQIFLGWLSDNINRIPCHIRFFLTGRPDVPSYLRHDDLSSMMHRVILDEIDKFTVSKDIYLYIHHNLDGRTWKPKVAWKAQAQDVDAITHQADGLFIYAATAVRYIQQRSPKIDPVTSMKYLAPGLGNDLSHLYFQIINEAIPKPGTDATHQEQYKHSMEVLGTLFNLLEPLDLHALGDLLNMQKNEIENILTPLSAVIGIPEDDQGKVQLIHLSFREFMTGKVQEQRPDLLCGTQQQQQRLASNLICIMNNELRFNICDLPTSYKRNKDISALQVRVKKHISHCLQYSCRYWVDHLVATTFNSETVSRAEDFLYQNFLFWLEVMSICGWVPDSLGALSRFMMWAKVRKLCIICNTRLKI
jgi:hypothetical protein